MSFKYVTIYYGPCDSFYTVTHKPQKLHGLRDQLQRLGYRVDLAPVMYVNYCMLEICGHEVFRCNIQNLLFNMPHDRDPVCQRAVCAVLRATGMLSRARTHMWLWMLIDEELFARSDAGPHRHFHAPTEDIPSFTTCLECTKCCGVLARRKE